ncbi:hypothetical protein PQ469_27780 [Mucilaginibacter sp. KACC 22773]|uniref:lanthionine synthetase LanC family protein n=1 Tax=Mucilaginibacter sp. KACC 22773 TaxID=3025671 RepID=UPI0023670964|nr:lanthionine synthetase LanC family protein [Mucilaginibacter sp. KACC 22773]WDF77694.1 hypothetical protein PQ469_27780 [Mucilaginibacter sp. KACC 22773]
MIRERLQSPELISSIGLATLETGLLGLSLFYSYYALYTNNKAYRSSAEHFLWDGLRRLDIYNFKPTHKVDSIDVQLSGLGRFIEFNKKNVFFTIDADDYFADLDVVMSELIIHQINRSDFDTSSGALAAGNYFLSRTEQQGLVERNLINCIKECYNRAHRDPDGDFYWPAPQLENKVYLGISHGSASIINFLANVYEKGIEQNLCLLIIRSAAKFLIKQKRDQINGLFPNYIGEDLFQTQFSQCYGDLGIGYALYKAALLLDDPILKNKSSEILETCLHRSKEDNLTWDASLTYGAAGLGLAFNKIAAITNDARYKYRSTYWHRQTAGYAGCKNKFGGFLSMVAKPEEYNWNTCFSLGIIGIGIAHMLHLKPSLPPIDELLYIS